MLGGTFKASSKVSNGIPNTSPWWVYRCRGSKKKRFLTSRIGGSDPISRCLSGQKPRHSDGFQCRAPWSEDQFRSNNGSRGENRRSFDHEAARLPRSLPAGEREKRARGLKPSSWLADLERACPDPRRHLLVLHAIEYSADHSRQMFAGSDTTGITLCAILYHVLKDSKIHRKLRAALKEASLVYPVSYNDAKEISYLSVIISEATRVHPVIGLPLERVVPQEGLRLPDGRFLPAGTIVGMNPWVVNRDEGVYGADADHFVPERWLQQEDETGAEWKERSRKMRESDLTFGGENRVCLGKNAGLVEIYKLTATLFSVYKVCLFNIVTDPSHFFISASDSRYGEVKQLTEWGRGVSDGIRGPHQRMGGYQYMVHVSNRAKDPL